MSLNKTLQDKQKKRLVWAFFVFLLSGLVFSVFAQLSTAPKDFLINFVKTLSIHSSYIALFFIFDFLIFSRIKNIFWQYLSAYLLSGFAGLCLVEWIILHNFQSSVLAGVFLFSFWAGIITLPKLFMFPYSTPEYRAQLFEFLAVYIGVAVSLIAFAYFIFHNFIIWQIGVIFLYIFINILYIREFFVAQKIAKKEIAKIQTTEDEEGDSEKMTKNNNVLDLHVNRDEGQELHPGAI